MTGQNDPQDESFTGHVCDDAGHCLLTGRYFEPCLPQGSILGPHLFIFYINDLPDVYSLTQSLLFADDASIFCSHKDANHLVSIVNNELAKIIIWLKVNKLSLNLTKTNFMIFHWRQKKVNVNVPLTP